MDKSGLTAAYARRSDTPHSPALGQSSSRSRRSSTSTGPRSSSSTTSSSSTRYSGDPPQAEATAPVPSRAGLHPRHDTRDEVRQRTDDQTSARSRSSRSPPPHRRQRDDLRPGMPTSGSSPLQRQCHSPGLERWRVHDRCPEGRRVSPTRPADFGLLTVVLHLTGKPSNLL